MKSGASVGVFELLECPICFDDIAPEDVYCLPCFHKFCEKCYQHSAKKGKKCPECRKAVSDDFIDIAIEKIYVTNPTELMKKALYDNDYTLFVHAISLGAKISKVSNDGLTPAFTAAVKADARFLEFFLGSGIDPNSYDFLTGDSLMHYAASAGALSCLGVLVREGAKINSRDEDGATPLHAAAHAGHADCVTFLVSAGADVKAKDSYGNSAAYVTKSKACKKALKIKSASKVDTMENVPVKVSNGGMISSFIRKMSSLRL